MAPGRQPVVVTVDGVGVGVTLCYDIRFPHLYTELVDRGATVITVSASWGRPRQARAVDPARPRPGTDSGCFVAAADQAYPGPELAATAPTGVGGSSSPRPWARC